MVGTVLGVLLVSHLRTQSCQAIFGGLALIVGHYLGFGRSEWRLGETMPRGIKRAILSPMVGFSSVLMGIGGGSFGVPLMTFPGRPIHRAVAPAAGFRRLIALPSVIAFLFVDIDQNRPPFTVGAVNLVAFATVITMTLITAPWGVRLAHAMDPKPLKRIFAVFLVLVAMNMLRKALWG